MESVEYLKVDVVITFRVRNLSNEFKECEEFAKNILEVTRLVTETSWG